MSDAFGTPTALNSFNSSIGNNSAQAQALVSPTISLPNVFTGQQTSTPTATSTQFSPLAQSGGLLGAGAAGNLLQPPSAQGAQTYNPSTGTWQAYNSTSNNITPVQSSTGGISFNANSLPSNFNTSSPTGLTPAGTSISPASGGLSQYLTNTTNTGNGQVTTDGNGNVTGYTPNTFNIDTSGSVNSDVLGAGTTSGDVMNQQSTYAGLVNALAQAQGYSPAYIAAQQAVFQGQANQSNIAAQMATGVGTTGLSQGQASTLTGQEQALNQQQLTGAQISLTGQQLARTGDIAAAQTQLSSSPTGLSGAQAIQQYQALQQEYPNAGIPPYNPNQDPIQQYNSAMQMVGQSAAYQSQFQSTYSTPGGGTGIYSKLDVTNGALQSDGQGGYTLVSGAAAALGAAQAGVINSSLDGLATINTAVQSSSATLSTTQQFMNQYGLNQSDIPIVNQVANAVKSQGAPAGAVAAFQDDLTAIRSDFSQYLVARGGSIAGSGPDSPEVLNALPDNVSLAQIQQVVGQMQTDGTNTATALNTQIQQALSGLQTNTVQSSSTGGSSTAAPGSFASGTGWN